MKEVRLLTRDGSYVTTAIVPPYILMPEVFLWGFRYFGKTENLDEYREVFCSVVLETKD